jgi:hypothetical protein
MTDAVMNIVETKPVSCDRDLSPPSRDDGAATF